jgi:hypothetical protein
VARYNYYGFKGDFTWHLASQADPRDRWGSFPRLLRDSEVIWCQGPRGGVRVVHLPHWESSRKYGYIKPDTEAMKEFVWIKLRAQELGLK